MKFTDGRLRSLSSIGSRFEIADEGCTCLYVRVSRSGNKTFVFKYRRFGHLVRITLGQFPALSLAEARSKASDLTRRVRLGEDFKVSPRVTDSLEQLVDDYIRYIAGQGKRSWQEDERILYKDFVPRFGKRSADGVSKSELISMLDEIAIERQAGCMANRTLSTLRSFYRWATCEDLIAYDPSAGIRKRVREYSRDRSLSEPEIRQFWDRLNNAPMSRQVEIAIRLVLLTGKRVTEIVRAKWSEIEGGWWVTPKHKSKTLRLNRTPITPLTRQLLDELRVLTGHQEWLLPSRVADSPIQVSAISRAVSRSRPHIGLAHWTARDLRRSAATHLGRLGVEWHIIRKILNHSDGSVSAIYNRYSYDEEKKLALITWDEEIQRICELSPREMVRKSA